MKWRYYQLSFYLNAQHRILLKNNSSASQVHPHTWELNFQIVKKRKELILFHIIENIIERFLKQLEGQYLNDLCYFRNINPTTENIAEVIFLEVNKILKKEFIQISKLTVVENASRSYVIEDKKVNFSGFSPNLKKEDSLDIQTKKKINDFGSKDSDNDLLESSDSEKNTSQLIEKMSNEIRDQVLKKIRSTDMKKEVKEKTEESIDNEQVVSVEEEIPQSGISKFDSVKKSFDSLRKSKKKDRGNRRQYINSKKRKEQYIIIFLFYIIISLGLYFIMTRNGVYPWGSDTWGHLFKGHIMYKHLLKGDIYPLFTKYWYNGIQPFRYWAPVPYYILAFLEFVFNGNSLFSYYSFIYLVFFIGALPWILFGKHYNRLYLGSILGVIWFIYPDNLRVLFGEGNLPRVVVTVFFPYLLLVMTKYFYSKKYRYLSYVFILMFFITLSHAMIAALTGISMFLYLLIFSLVQKKRANFIQSINLLIAAVLGIVSSGLWLYPALKGGIMSMDSNYNVVMKHLTYYITQSLNPFFRSQIAVSDAYYFGISILVISIIGIIYSKPKVKTGFILVIVLFLGTTKALLPILLKLPMNQLFWMMRFTPMAMAFFTLSLLQWGNLKKKTLFIFLLVLSIEGIFTLNVLEISLEQPRLSEAVEKAMEVTHERIALIDLSVYDADASYYITFNDKKEGISQSFGWAWQGATTGENIVNLNTAYTKGYYIYLFDRALEMGNDTLIISNIYVEELNALDQAAKTVGYHKYYRNSDVTIYTLDTQKSFGVQTEYKYLAIGSDVDNIIFSFPQFKKGNSNDFDDYSLEELKKYDKIYLSRFIFDNEKKMLTTLKKLEKSGVDIYINISTIKKDTFAGYGSLVDVISIPISLENKLPILITEKKRYETDIIISDVSNWRTVSIENLNEIKGRAKYEDSMYTFWGSRYDIDFIGLNLPYYLYKQKDPEILSLLGEIFELTPETQPTRKMVPLTMKVNLNKITIQLEKDIQSPVTIPLAQLQGFYCQKKGDTEHNLIKMQEKRMEIIAIYPYKKIGIGLFIGGIVCFLVFLGIEKHFSRILHKIIGVFNV